MTWLQSVATLISESLATHLNGLPLERDWDGDARAERAIRRVALAHMDGEPTLGSVPVVDVVCGVLDRNEVTPRDESALLETLQTARRRERRHVLRVLNLRGRTTHAELVDHLKAITAREAAEKLARALE